MERSRPAGLRVPEARGSEDCGDYCSGAAQSICDPDPDSPGSARYSRAPGNATDLTPGQSGYVHALRYPHLTCLYDGIVRLTTREATFKRFLIQEIARAPGDRILDVGCGTGTLAIGLQRSLPHSEVVGLDGDPDILQRARMKASKAGCHPRWEVGMSWQLPFESDSFCWVVSSLLYHHLSHVEKRRSLDEALRVLRPGGTLLLADWGLAGSLVARGAYLIVQLVDGFENTAENVAGRLPVLISDAGFISVMERRRFATPLGVLSVYKARRPDPAAAETL